MSRAPTMPPPTPPASDAARRQGYYAEAASWAADTHGGLRASRRVAWWVAGAACVVAALEALALAALSPLKTVKPYVISVDRQTGYAQTVQPLAAGALAQDTAVTQANLVQYVLARETFDGTDLREAYRRVMLLSAGGARDDYARLMQRSTPQSPLNLYPATSTVNVDIESVSLLSPTTALVRFTTTRRDQGAQTGQVQPYVAAIAFRYSSAPMSQGDRFTNPLGFQVTRYRRDSEAPAATSVVFPSAPTAAASAAAPATTLQAPTTTTPTGTLTLAPTVAPQPATAVR